MGCGACASSDNSVVTPYSSIQFKLKQLLNKVHHNSLLKEDQCKNVSEYLFAHKNLPSLSITRHQVKDPGSPPSLLSQVQKTIWKVLILGTHKVYQPTVFKQNIQAITQGEKTSFYQIQLDVKRTYPQCKTINRQNLEIILRNVAVYFSGVGYTQGMNFYIGFLLQCGFSAQQCFWLYVCLSTHPNYLLIRHFTSSFESVNMHTSVLEQKLKQQSVQVCQKLQSSSITPHLYSFSWFLCCFLYSLQPETCVLIWDMMIKEGEIGGIVGIALQIMQQGKQQIVNSNGPQELLMILRAQNISKKYTVSQTQKMIQRYSKKDKITFKDLENKDAEFKEIRKSEEKYEQFIRGVRRERKQK